MMYHFPYKSSKTCFRLSGILVSVDASSYKVIVVLFRCDSGSFPYSWTSLLAAAGPD